MRPERCFLYKRVRHGLSLFFQGLCLEITGPTLIDLKLRTHSNFEAVATAVSGRSAGFFIGSALGGVLVDKLGRFSDLILAISLDLMAGFTAALPWARMTELMFAISLCAGTCEGVINIAGQKLIINMWQEKSASPLHLLHAGFGCGSFIIPLIANPFLAVLRGADNNLSDISTLAPTTTAEPVYLKQSRIEYAYAIAGMIVVVVSFVFYVYHFTGIRDSKAVVKSESEGDTSKPLSFRQMFNPATCTGGRFFYGLEIFVLVALFFFQATGGERVGGKFIRTFAIDYHKFSNDDGTYINTVFWITFTCGRVAGFVAANWIPIRILILIETGGCLAGSIALMFFGTSGPLALWVIMPILGFFIAPLFPSGIGWANFHIDVTGIAITVFLLGGSVGALVYMKVIGFLYDNYGPKMYIYTLLAYGIGAFVLAVLMDLVGAQHGNRFNWKKEEKDIPVEGHISEDVNEIKL
ncbi:MF4B1-like protein [Mya arenaria]|uniref:MF4B1-like protein n=1 Tax=Mya arenaria TaxID=6604 RepID=A0ABY7DDL8_MYAAR|nr:MF4B1-like protein [Mya arenaria]